MATKAPHELTSLSIGKATEAIVFRSGSGVWLMTKENSLMMTTHGDREI
jgi:hypothetical protein